ncbi:unnamed protein product, partial [Closterium sp. Naga37s-1]
MGGRELDLHLLYREVTGRGGLMQVRRGGDGVELVRSGAGVIYRDGRERVGPASHFTLPFPPLHFLQVPLCPLLVSAFVPWLLIGSLSSSPPSPPSAHLLQHLCSPCVCVQLSPTSLASAGHAGCKALKRLPVSNPPFFTCAKRQGMCPRLDNTFPQEPFPSSALLLVSTSPRQHFSSSALLLVSTSPRQHFSSSALLLVSTSPRQHFSSSALLLVSTAPRQHFSSSALLLISTSPHQHFPSSAPFHVSNPSQHHSLHSFPGFAISPRIALPPLSASPAPQLANIGRNISGIIRSKCDNGYFITVPMGDQVLHGILYHPPSTTSSSPFAPPQPVSFLLNAFSLDSALIRSQTHGRRRRRKRRRRAELLAAAAGGVAGVVVPPKQNRTGYNFFFGEQRMKLKAHMPDVPDREISRLIGQRWMALSPQDRIVTGGVAGVVVPPKQNRTGYNFFFGEQRMKLKAHMPDVPDREIGQRWMALSPQDRIRMKLKAHMPDVPDREISRLIGQRWMALSPQDRIRMKLKAHMPDVPDREISRLIGQRWMALSPQDRILVQLPLVERGPRPLQAELVRLQGLIGLGAEGVCLRPLEAHAPALAVLRQQLGSLSRGRGRFFGEQRMKFKADMPDVPDREISRLIGQRWMALSPQDRIPYQEQAERDRKQHVAEMMEYNEEMYSAPPLPHV